MKGGNRVRDVDYGIIDKDELMRLLIDLQEGLIEERRMRDKMCELYERQLKIQDAEIKRLQSELALAHEKTKTSFIKRPAPLRK